MTRTKLITYDNLHWTISQVTIPSKDEGNFNNLITEGSYYQPEKIK